MSVFSSIKNWFKKTFGGGSSSSTRRASRVSNYGGGGSRSYSDYSGGRYKSDYEDRQEREKRQRQEQAKKRQATTDALSSISKRTDSLASGKSSSVASSATHATSGQGTARVLAKINEKSKATPPDPKVKAAQDSRDRATAKLKQISNKVESDRKSFDKATGNKYNANTGNKAHDKQARINQKMQLYDPNAEKWEVEHHPIASSAARGALSGVTFGGSEIVARKSKNRQKTGAEQFYQEHKNAKAEMAGEIAGSLVGFGLTEAGATKLASKVAPKALKSGSANVAKSLAKNSAFRKAAQKEAERAGVEITEEVIERFARQRAQRLVNSIGSDMAVNVTTGGAMDVNQSLRESMDENGNVDWKKFRKEMGTNAALNLGLGGAVTVLPALRTSKGLIHKGAREDALDLARRMSEEGRMRGIMADAFSGNAERAGKNAKALAEQGVKGTTDALSPIKLSSKADKMTEMRQAMQATFARDADEARRIDMNEILAQNSPLRQTDEAVQQAAEPSIQNEAAQVVKENFERATPPRPSEADFPVEGTPEANDMLNRINEGKRRNAETYANEQQALEGRVRELENEPPRIEGEEPLRYNNVAEDTPIGGSTIGERMAKSAYERNTGETLDEGIKSSWHDAWNASREYHASHATGRDVRASKTSVSQLNMMDSDTKRKIRDKLFDEGWLDYTVVHTDEMLDKVSKEFHDDPKRWVDDMIDVNNGRKLDFRETPEWQARVHYIMAVVDPTADPASEIAYTEAYKLATQMSSKAGQTNNLRRQFVHLTPAGRRDAIMDEMAQILYNSQGFHNAHKDMPTDKYDALAYVKEFLEGDEEIEKRVKKLVEVGGLRRDAEYGIDVATESAAKSADDLASVADELPTGNAPKASKSKSDSDEIMEAHADLLAALNEKNPKSKLDVVQEIRYLNMLGNPKTHIRNIFGSGFFSPIRQISNAIRSGIEKSSLVKNSGLEITPHGGLSPTALFEANRKNPTTEAGKKAKDAFERLKPELLGSMKLDNQLYSGRAKTLSGKMLDKVSDFNSTLLSKEDDYFKQKAFRENYIKSYEAYKKRGTPITKKIEKKIEAEAMQEAQIATFNEYNEFAKFLSRISRNANDPNASGLAKTGGLAVNAVMPFTKVPANIMKQSVNYSPIGLAKGFSRMQSAIKKGDSAALNTAIDELASGTTGTGIFLAGMLLGKTTDWFTTNAGKDDAAAKFKKAQGVQNYSVTFTNKLDGKKYSMTLDWLVPNSATFFAGVELANQMKSGNFNALDLSGSWAQITSRIVEPVMETSMLSGLYSMLESTRNGYGDDDKQSALSIMLRETAQSYVNSLVPTMLGQAARTAYSSDLQVTGETDNEYFRNQLKSKLGLGETNILGEALGADTTAYGDVKGKKETTGDYVKSGLKNFLSPANIQKIDLDEMDQAKIKQYEDAVKNGADPQEMAYLFPKKQYKKQFTTGNLDVKLSNRDLSAYNQAKTTGGAEGARYALESIMFNRYTKDENGNRHSTDDAYTPEQKAAIIKQFEGKSIREVEKWVREQPQFKNATEAEQKRVIDGLWSYSKQGKAQSAKRVGEQAVIKAQGGDVNEYNFNNEITEKKREVLQPLVDNGVITYEEAVDFARYAGKTYYYEDDEGGHSQTYYNKGVMMDYLKSKGYSDEKCAALFNAFKAWNAKEYGSSSGRGRYGRRRRGWRRWGRGGHSSKAKVPAPKTIKASSFTKGEALVSKKKSSGNTTNTNPKLERVKAKIDLPTPKR